MFWCSHPSYRPGAKPVALFLPTQQSLYRAHAPPEPLALRSPRAASRSAHAPQTEVDYVAAEGTTVMHSTSELGPPFDDLRQLNRTAGKVSAWLWQQRNGFLTLRLPLLVEAAAATAFPGLPGSGPHRGRLCPSWLAAILWDELARRDVTERYTDALLGLVGRDPSVGPFQVTGGTAREVLNSSPWGKPYRSYSLAQLRELLLDFTFAARIVGARICQILETWQRAGHDPCRSQRGLGPHQVSPLQLVGTLYSQGLGSPKPNPKANGRGRQIARFAAQAAEAFDLEVCGACKPQVVSGQRSAVSSQRSRPVA